MKNLVIPTLIVSIFALFIVSSLQAEVREWTQAATGNKISGEFIKQKDEKTVTLRIKGRNHDIPVASLSSADQAYLKEKASKADSGKAMEKKGDDKKKGEKPALPEGEVTVVLSDVHICCKSCVKAVEAIGAVKKFRIGEKVKIKADKGAKTITIDAPSGEEAERALYGVLASGFYGKSDQEALPMDEIKGEKSKDFKSTVMTVINQHMCCGSCVKAAKKAVSDVEGVDGDALEIEEDATRFTVRGKDFKPYDVIMALRAVGLGGTWQ